MTLFEPARLFGQRIIGRGLFSLAILFHFLCAQHQPATRIPLQPNHTETPTHIEPRTIRPMW